ncbi:DUF3592 domain-containing protein [Nocardiopsis sp. MG754419]|uniref:DUF3592 domain-containing protein n=1 Tax=Nocardiopsis sp. MG754419 TaxID=2259865 RepID=UPI001BAB3A52|nr:DUF3592 domain-containing protein [Nocardiopsis sp. MG754419]MBR8744100.1 hypothetical protein [Nocardiopsis sp. MG754419]
MEQVFALASVVADSGRLRSPVGTMLVGALFLWAFLGYRLLRIERVRRRDAGMAAAWPVAVGTIVGSRPTWGRPSPPVPEFTGTRTAEVEKVGIAYAFEVDGRAYEGDVPTPAELTRRRWGSTRSWKYAERHPAGSTITVRYDPEDPTRNCADPDTPVPAEPSPEEGP